MRELGSWTDPQLLDMWARDTPQTIFPGRGLGILEPGREASFLALIKNPLDDLDTVRRSISLRVTQGCVLEGM